MSRRLDIILKVTGIALAAVFGAAMFCVILLAIDPLLAKLADFFIFAVFIVLSIVCMAKRIRGSVFILLFWCLTLAVNIAVRYFTYTGGLYSQELYITLIKYALPAAEIAGAVLISLWFIKLLRGGKDTDGNNS